MSSNTLDETKCKGIVQQGERKGLQCQRERTNNGYCVYHKRNYEYDQLIAQGKHLCSGFFRGCDNELTQDELNQFRKYCGPCRLQKSGKTFNCSYKGCNFKIEKKEDKYCNKHVRELLRDNEKENNIQYCDISRGCFNTLSGDIKCMECRNKEKIKVANDLYTLRKYHNIESPENAEPNTLFEKQEVGSSDIKETWRNIQRNAILRKILFTLSQQDFEKLVIQPCNYCGFYSNIKINGIDRIDNNKGYVLNNCITACKMCNMMKGVNHPNAFLDKINRICSYRQTPTAIINKNDVKWTIYFSSGRSVPFTEYAAEIKRKRNHIQFLLSEKEFYNLIQGECYLCGILPMEGHHNGIDRFDNNGHYTVENSRSCCGHCNIMKREYSYEDFMRKCIQIKSHKCDRNRFNAIPVSDTKEQKLRNEYYTAEDIAKFLQEGYLTKYLEWCEEKGKSVEFTSAITYIASRLDEDIVEQIKKELEHERVRKSVNTILPEKKHIQAKTVYSYLVSQKHDEFIQWYTSMYNKTSLFDESFNELKDAIPTVSKEDGIQLCKNFLYYEKSRRNTQKIRGQKGKNVVEYTPQPVPQTITQNTPVVEVKNIMVQLPVKKDAIAEQIVERQSCGKQMNTDETTIQWKAIDVYKCVVNNNEQCYFEYLKGYNNIEDIQEFESRWNSLLKNVKGKTFENCEIQIRDFIVWLRNIRHNLLCAVNNANKIITKEDRQHYRADGILLLFKMKNINEIAKFKSYTENYAGDNPSDSKWMQRWNEFITSVENIPTYSEKKKCISKFLMAQRKKKNDRKT